MRPQHEFEAARALIEQGINDCEISRRLGIPRGTIRDWRRPVYVPRGFTTPQLRGVASWSHPSPACPRCDAAEMDEREYAYLLGLYLGDGCLSRAKSKPLHRLRIVLDDRYLGIIGECIGAIDSMHRGINQTHVIPKIGCVEVGCSWKHWPCLFPQHGPGRKHERPIVLAPWQTAIVGAHPDRLLRGLIHSDGWRGINRVTMRGKRYAYPRYEFVNVSEDIHKIFGNACEKVEVQVTRGGHRAYVSRRHDVAKLDQFIGYKY